MKKKYIKPLHPHVPHYSEQQANNHEQQLEFFDMHSNRAHELDDPVAPFSKEVVERSHKEKVEEKQYFFDSSTGLWTNRNKTN